MPAPFEGWAVLELLGHRRHVGYVQEVTMFGGSMLSIGVLSYDREKKEFSRRKQYYSASALYALTPISEEEAHASVKPQSWELEGAHLLGEGDTESPDDDESAEDPPLGGW